MRERAIYALVLFVQLVCTTFFVGDILSSLLGLPFGPFSWQVVELIEIGAAVGLIVGIVLGAILLSRARASSRRDREALRRAQSAFHEMLEERFAGWELTPAERDVALFAIKGLSTAEIAALRGVSEGTIKAQTNAIYRKAGVSGRPQLLSLFIDDLIDAEKSPDQSSAA